MKLVRMLAYGLVLLCFTTALAQTATCGAMVLQALGDVETGCAATGRNQACYGNVSLQATPRAGVADFTFAQTGDLANVADIDTLRLSALDSVKNTWGIALMKLQANLPDTLPGQNVTFLMFGDVQIQNAVTGNITTIQASAKSSANIRNAPSTSGQIAGSLTKGDAVTVNGRNTDSSWLRVQISESSSLGWVSASLLTATGDVSTLSVIDPKAALTAYTPMQAFYFQTGITQTSCAQAPQDGILIQTPKGAGQIDLRANDVDVQLGSTAYLQAQPSGNMTISVVEGEGHITSDGRTVAVPAGTEVTIPVDANLRATGAPSDAKPYDPALVANLPIHDLPLPITIAPPLTAAQIQAMNATPAPASSGNAGAASPGNLTGMSEAQFCAALASEIQATGRNKSQILSLMEKSPAAKNPAAVAQFAQMLNGCP